MRSKELFGFFLIAFLLIAFAGQAHGNLEVVSSHSYVGGSGWLHVVGEVENKTEQIFKSIKVVATFYDSSGNVIGTDFGYTDIDAALPGEKVPFTLATDEISSYEKYKLQVQGRATSSPRNQRKGVEVLSSQSYVESGYFHVVGEVDNTLSKPVKNVKIVVTIYNSENQVRGVDFAYTELDVIASDSTSPFDTGIENRDGFDNYKLQTQFRVKD